MNILDLKQSLIDGQLGDELIVFVCQGDTFIAETYIDEICEQKNLAKSYISFLRDTTDSAMALVMDFSRNINILKTDSFNEASEDYSQFKNCVVICDKIDKSVPESIKEYVVEVPKLVEWQLKDYIKANCDWLSPSDVDLLCAASDKNPFRIRNELQKLSLVDEPDRATASAALRAGLFVKKPVFELVNALVRCDKAAAAEFLRHIDDYSASEIDPIGLATLTLAKFRNILLLCCKSGVKESELGLSSGAIWHIKNDNRGVPVYRMQKAINFLSNINSRLRSNPSALDFSGNRRSALLEYIVIGTLNCDL